MSHSTKCHIQLKHANKANNRRNSGKITMTEIVLKKETNKKEKKKQQQQHQTHSIQLARRMQNLPVFFPIIPNAHGTHSANCKPGRYFIVSSESRAASQIFSFHFLPCDKNVQAVNIFRRAGNHVETINIRKASILRAVFQFAYFSQGLKLQRNEKKKNKKIKQQQQ